MRHTLVLALLLAAAPALAQTPLTGNSGLPTSNTPPLSGTEVAPGPAAGPSSGPSEGRRAHAHHGRRSLAARFAEANTTHDGRLTLAQAQDARMNAVVRDFGQIDRQNRGYVTLDEIKAFRHERRAARARAETH